MRWTVTGLEVGKKKFQPWMLYATAVDLFVADRLLKFFVMDLPPAAPSGIVSYSLFKNEGIIFSLPFPDVIFWPLASLIFALLGVYFYKMMRERNTVFAGIGLIILLGALSNLIDRALYGATIDYLIFFGRSAVNLADGMILGGVIALLLLQRKKSLA